jgi:hypothetical protein
MTEVDRTSVSSVVSAMYRTLSFRSGSRPDWSQERQLFEPNARLVRNSDKGRETFDVEGYIRNFEAMIDRGELPSFQEKEIASRVDQFGNIAHVFSTYEAKLDESSPEPLFRGINSIQLLQTGGRWRIVSIIWQRETPTLRLPGTGSRS